MKRVSLLSLVLVLFALPAVAQQEAPVITSIQPSVGSVEGGTLVTIRGRNLTLPPNFACILPCPTTVRFGGAEVSALAETDTEVTVRTPAHAAGTVDVTVRTGDARATTVPNGFTFIEDRERGYATFLLPIYLDGEVPGGHGSLWRTEFWIRNDGPSIVQLAPWECPPGQACPAVVPLTHPLQPGESLRNLPAFFRPPTAHPGRLLYVTRGGAHQVRTSLRLWDVSRESLDAGTEIPVVSERHFLTDTAHLLSIPAAPGFRTMLRIYDVAQKESRFRVRIYAQREGATPGVPMRELELTARSSDEGPFPLEPAYAEFSRFEPVVTGGLEPPLLRVEIEPLTKGSIFWSFVAITNNETQRVTLVTPQR